MNGYAEKTETVNFKEEIGIRYRAEAAVIGGGPSGLCAAIAAARCGADTDPHRTGELRRRNGDAGAGRAVYDLLRQIGKDADHKRAV